MAKKFLYQEHCLNSWDEFLPILTQTHNASTGIYGYSSEQLMFGTRTTNPGDLLTFDWTNSDEKTFVDNIFDVTEAGRKKAVERMKQKSEQNKTFKNATRVLKTFKLGSLVLHRQLQVSTGPSSSMKPKFTGPYVITSLNKDESTAHIEHIKSGNMLKAHFSNLQLLNFNPKRLTYDKKMYNDLAQSLLQLKSELKTNSRKVKK